MSNAPAAFEATYSDWKLVKSRKVVQIVLEVPMEKADLAYQVLGGMPNHAAEAWLAVARMNGKAEQKDRKRWHDLSVAQQAGIRCNEVAFHQFLAFKLERKQPEDEKDAATILRNYFKVNTRKDIPANAWNEFDGEYQLWARVA